MKRKIRAFVEDYFKSRGVSGYVTFGVDPPKVEEFGHYSTNAALVAARVLKRSPLEIGEELKKYLEERESIFDRIEVVRPGFVNFFLKKSYVFDELSRILSKGVDYFKEDLSQGGRIQVEFVSANPTGPLHIGHGRGAAIGDSLSKILSFFGYDVSREYYINDAGNQMRLLGESAFARYKELLGVDCVFPEDGYRGDYIVDIARELVEKYGGSLLEREDAVDICRREAEGVILDGIVDSLSRFRVRFDVFFRESHLFDEGTVESTVELLREKGLVYESKGALWFKSTAFGDDKDRVLRKNTGEYTYFASDIAYHRDKFLDRKFDRVVDIWGADHHGYVNRMKSAARALGVEPERLRIILVQMVNLIRDREKVSMSTRRGEFVKLNDILDEVGVDATRFMFVSRSVNTHIDFDVDVVKKQTSENPVYYVQYAYARIMNIFKNIEDKGLRVDESVGFDELIEEEEFNLALETVRFKDSLLKAHDEMEPYYVTKGLLDVAEKLHQFYNRRRVIGSGERVMSARVKLLKAVACAMLLGMQLIGVEAKKEM